VKLDLSTMRLDSCRADKFLIIKNSSISLLPNHPPEGKEEAQLRILQTS
jgi:hypothetical protein